MLLAIFVFFAFLLISHLLIRQFNSIKSLNILADIIEYIWLFGAFSGVIFGFAELREIEERRVLQSEYNSNWVNFNSERMKLIHTIQFYSLTNDNEEINEANRWMTSLWQELEKGYHSELWKSIIYSNYDKIVPRNKNSAINAGHQVFRNTQFNLDTSKVSNSFLREIRPIIIALNNVSLKWKRWPYHENENETDNVITVVKAFLNDVMPYFLSLILALRISKIYVNRRLRKIKAV